MQQSQAGRLSPFVPFNYNGIPLTARALRAVRNAEIRAERPHTSTRLLALRWKTTERNIRIICGELVDERQGGLF